MHLSMLESFIPYRMLFIKIPFILVALGAACINVPLMYLNYHRESWFLLSIGAAAFLFCVGVAVAILFDRN